MDLQDLLTYFFWGGGKTGKGLVPILTFNELVLIFGGSYVCANFGENRSRNATVKSARRRIHRHTDRRKLIFNALHRMQTRSYDENSVCLSVRLSVKRVQHCDKTEDHTKEHLS